MYQRTKHWLKSSAECTSRAIVSLELCERPVKSTKQAEKLEGVCMFNTLDSFYMFDRVQNGNHESLDMEIILNCYFPVNEIYKTCEFHWVFS